MTVPDNSFLPPTLHLLIVDDDQEDWTPRLLRSFEDYLANWGLYRLGFFEYEPHLCRSKEGFQETTTRLLEAGSVVYAAVDLILPRKDTDEKPDPTIWKGLIFWCLERIKATATDGQNFDFCVMSGDESALDDLYSDAQHGRELKTRGIKRVSKSEVDQSPMPEGRFALLWDDVRNFIRSHISCCTIPGKSTDSSWSTMIWFGSDPKLSELRYQADYISKNPKGGLYLVFSDATGFEEDWFQLVCQLRGTPPAQSKIRSLENLRPHRDQDWIKVFEEPPEMFLITRLDCAAEHDCDLQQIFEDTRFFAKIRELRTSHVFIQFPYVSGEQNLALSLDLEERQILDLCLDQIGAPPSQELETGFAYSKNPRILFFPSYNELKSAGVIRQTIEFEAQQCRKREDRIDRPLHPEVAAVLAEIPWHQHQDGLYELRQSIRHAYKNALTHQENHARYVGERHFSTRIKQILRSNLGFSLRGRWLFDRLAQRRMFAPSQDPATEMLLGLEEVYDLYDGLERLVELYNEIKERGERHHFADFSIEHFEALRRAYEFLNVVFDDKEYLRNRIKRFRQIVDDPSLHNRFREFYPSLRERDNWQELVQQMRFVWPYDTFPLPASVSEYLRHSNVVAEFSPDFQSVLRRYPLLGKKWKALSDESTVLKELLQAREDQRWNAECYVRDCDSQPVCVSLAEEIGERTHPSMAFELALRSLLYFNSYLAICENYYKFDRNFLKPTEAREQIERPDLWLSIVLINRYIKRLKKAKRIKETVLTRWRDSWPIVGEQTDAVRLVTRICQWLESDGTLRKSDLEPVSRLAALAEDARYCPLNDFFDTLRLIRNGYSKVPNPTIWEIQGERIWDLLRRFVAATTHPALRLGFLKATDGNSFFWNRRGIHTEDALAENGANDWRMNIFIDSSSGPHFPIDELVRVNPQDWSIWGAYSAGEDWFNLTYLDGGDSRCTPGPDRLWLPSKEEFAESNVWRWANGEI